MKLTNIDELMEMWNNDSTIDDTEPSRELAKIPNLHAKYLRILSQHNLIVRKLQNDYNTLKSVKWSYYSGDLNNPEDLAKYGYEPWSKKVLRQDIQIYLDSDTDLNKILLKKIVHQEIVDFCTSVLKELGNRTWQLKTIVDWERFVGGK